LDEKKVRRMLREEKESGGKKGTDSPAKEET